MAIREVDADVKSDRCAGSRCCFPVYTLVNTGLCNRYSCTYRLLDHACSPLDVCPVTLFDVPYTFGHDEYSVFPSDTSESSKLHFIDASNHGDSFARAVPFVC